MFSLAIIELSNVLQLYSGKKRIICSYYAGSVSLQPAHPGDWYVFLDITIIASFMQSLLSILACCGGLKVRSSIPDLVQDAVYKGINFK